MDDQTPQSPDVLIVEDDADIAALFAEVVRLAGRRSRNIYNGREALKMIEFSSHGPPSLVLLDLHLPEVEGTVILPQIRATEKWAKIPVCVITADREVHRKFHETVLLANETLIKPVSVADLLQLIQRYPAVQA